MATNKTIAPTGVTVQIPGLTDAPDMSVPANAIDKAIDGINTLNSQISTFIKVENGSATIASIAAGGIASTDIEISFPTGYTKANVPLPAYTSSGLPICSCYFGTSSDPTKAKVSVAVRNVTNAAVTNESVTVRVVFSKM